MRFFKVFFCQKGYEVFIANDGKQAVFIAKEERPDIILLDVKMSGLSGIEILQEIKKIDKNIKVVMMSAVNEQVVIDLAIKYGAVDYITKPFSLEQLERDIFLKVSE